MIRILLLCLISTKHALAQTVSWTVGTSVPTFNKDLKLVCTVATSCCTSSDRIWADSNGNQILNNGNTATPNKYEEDWDGGTTGFNLIIKNLQPTDVGVEYDCQYSLGNNKHNLTQDATWEYVPSSVSCPVTWSEGYLKGELNIARSAPSPTFFASYQGINITSDLMIKDETNFETWFYSMKVEIKKIVCGDRFTLSVITGTTTTEICDAEIKCQTCPKCGGRCFGWGCFGIVLAGLQCLAVGYFYSAIMKKENGKVIKAVAISGIIFLVINAITALPIGSLLCFCYDYDDTVNDIAYHKGPLFTLIGISSVFAIFTVLLYRCKDDKIDEYHAWIFFGVITYGIGLIIYIFSKGKKKKPIPV